MTKLSSGCALTRRDAANAAYCLFAHTTAYGAALAKRPDMGRILLSAILASASLSAAQAQDPPASSTPLVFDVRPSRFEESADERQERLLRRSRDLDFAFRSICNGCGSTYAPRTGTAFSPLNALAVRPNRQSRPEQEPERGDGAR